MVLQLSCVMLNMHENHQDGVCLLARECIYINHQHGVCLLSFVEYRLQVEQSMRSYPCQHLCLHGSTCIRRMRSKFKQRMALERGRFPLLRLRSISLGSFNSALGMDQTLA